MSSSGFARRSRRTRWHASTGSRATAANARCSGRIRRSTSSRSTRPTPASARTGSPGRSGEPARPGHAGRRAVEPVSARARHRRPAARSTASRRDRRLPRLRHARDAAEHRAERPARAGDRLLPVRRRGRRGAARPCAARCRRRQTQADLQLHERSAGIAQVPSRTCPPL